MVAKIIQNIANDVEFGKKEAFMEPFNPMITEYKPMYQTFLRNLVRQNFFSTHLFSQQSNQRKIFNQWNYRSDWT